ncbi:glycoside hydrolase family 5 protein [Mycena floridula]|nr:glycoside hydrolase family 5 protein [Mycena floridula]
MSVNEDGCALEALKQIHVHAIFSWTTGSSNERLRLLYEPTSRIPPTWCFLAKLHLSRDSRRSRLHQHDLVILPQPDRGSTCAILREAPPSPAPSSTALQALLGSRCIDSNAVTFGGQHLRLRENSGQGSAVIKKPAFLYQVLEKSSSPAPVLMASPSTDLPFPRPSSPNSNRSSPPLKQELNVPDEDPRPPKRRRAIYCLGCLAVLIIVILVVILPVYFAVIKPKNNKTNLSDNGSNSDGQGDAPSGTGTPSKSTLTTGGDGSTVTTDDGSTFVYKNQFGGYWIFDPNDPWNNGAAPNSWTPALNATWTWGKDKIFGYLFILSLSHSSNSSFFSVNLGGWLVLEPFIAPALFQKYPTAIDEWSLSLAMTADTSAGGGLSQIEDHYNTFITEQDIAEIAGAGLNWVRVPIPFWAIDKWPGEPFLEKTAWKYFLRLVQWCRKYGIRINLDLHTIPGSQNGFNHSGKDGQINFLNGVMGVANAQRALNYIRILTEFISQPEYTDVVMMFSIMNEPVLRTIGREQLSSFYVEAYKMIRGITGLTAGKGPFICFHDAFDGEPNWAGFLKGSDRVALDSHPYTAFSGQPNDEPIATGTGADAGGQWPGVACSWNSRFKDSQTAFGVTVAGEFSNAYNDCGLFVNGVHGTANFPDCTVFQDSSNWNASLKAGVQAFAEASMDSLQNWFFWTWKVGNSTNNRVEAPLWSYKLGLEGGWMPKDPRTTSGKCPGVTPFSGEYQPWMTGGPGAGKAAATAGFNFPPADIANAGDADALPTYTPTGTINTLPGPTFTPSLTVSLDGWYDAQDTQGVFTAVAGCTYPNQWAAVNVEIPPACTGA